MYTFYVDYHLEKTWILYEILMRPFLKHADPKLILISYTIDSIDAAPHLLFSEYLSRLVKFPRIKYFKLNLAVYSTIILVVLNSRK